MGQHIVTPRGPNEEFKTHEHSNATARGGEHNTLTAYNDYDCDGYSQHHTFYRGDEDYGNYNSDGYYTNVELEHHGYDSCGCNVHEANYGEYIYYHGQDGYGDYNSEGEYACASIENYYDGSCGYTSYEDGYYGCDDNTYGGGNHCDIEYGGYYNYYGGAKTGGYKIIDPPKDDDSGPTSREGGRGHREDDGMCGIAEHTPTMATILKRAIEREEMAGIIERPANLKSKYNHDLTNGRANRLEREKRCSHGRD